MVSGNDVYAGGHILSNSKGGPGGGGYWKNGKWVNLGATVKSIFVSGNDIYVCGSSMIPAYWKNSERILLPFLSENKVAYTYSIFVYSNDVYVCGKSKNNLGVDAACYWKNGEIIPLLSFDSKYDSSAASIFVSGKDVYVGGYIKNSYRFPTVAGYWKNGKWIELNPIDNKKSSEVSSIFVYGNDVYAGGYCRSSDGNIPGYWKNGEWVGFDADGGHDPVSSIIVVPRPTGQ